MKPLSTTVLLAGLVGVALAGCAQQDRDAILKSGLQAAKTRCNELKAQDEITTNVEYATCLNGKEEAAYSQADYRYMDLIEKFNEERLIIAEKLDRKQIDYEEAEKQLTALRRQLAAEARARFSGKATAGAAGEGAAAGGDQMNEIEPAAGGEAAAAEDEENKEYMD